MDDGQHPCGRCGGTKWADATPDQRAAEVARLRSLAKNPEFEPPGRMEICQACGQTVFILSQRFNVDPAAPSTDEECEHELE